MTVSDIGARLCVGCGMCCDGVLYDRARVAPGEEARMTAAGLELFDDEAGNRFFRQPCPHSDCSRCKIYETRFRICHTFECALLRRAQNGEISVADAQDKVATARKLLADAAASNPRARKASGRKALRAELADQLGTADEQDRQSLSRGLLSIIALDSYLERWFRHKTDKVSEAE